MTIRIRLLLIFLFLIFTCCTAGAQETRASLFNYGVASGDPLKDRVIIWTKIAELEPSATVNYEVSLSDNFAEIISNGEVKTDKNKDYTVKADIGNLKPGTYYYYRFKYKNSYSMTGRTKTLPENTRDFRVAFVSCQNYGAGYFTAYKHIVDANPDLIIFLGDFIYEYEHRNAVRVDSAGYAKDLETYRAKYKVYLTDQFLIEARSKIPMVAIWDDHEVMNDYSGIKLMKTDPQRLKDAYRSFFEYLPIREQDNFKIYRSFQVGDLVDFYMIDGRQYRDEEACENSFSVNLQCTARAYSPGRTYLGQEQKKWLLNGLKNSKSQWKVLGNNTLMMEFSLLRNQINFDQWDGYRAEKDELLKSIKDNHVKDFLVFSGDVHTFILGDILYNGEKIAPEFITSSITSPNPEILRNYPGLIQLLVKDIKYFNPFYKGYILADFQTRKTIVYYFGVDTIEKKDSKVLLLKKLEIARTRK
jgi:alkaline phosphatase D